MKKISICLLLITALILLVGCSQEYEPVESTEKEAKVVLTFSADGKEYEVRYELYRALFLANRTSVDGGDESVWEGDGADEYINAINEIIIAKTYEIYSAIHHAEEIGFNAYSKDVDDKIQEYIKGAVEGDDLQIGHGSYEAYLASLKENYLNYSVSVLLLRYSFAMDAINEYYGGYEHEVFGDMAGEYEITEANVKEYYYSDDCARIMQVYVPEGIRTKAWVEAFRRELLEKASEYDMAVHIITNTTATESDLILDGGVSGLVIGKKSLDSLFYEEYINTLFSLSTGEMSEIIEIKNTDADGYYVLYALDKNDEHLERCYDAVVDSYVDNIIGDKLFDATSKFMNSTSLTDSYYEIDHKNISMED